MTTTQQLSIILPVELADAVQAKVATGEYGTESEVIHSALTIFLARDQQMESWLRDSAGPALDSLKADPARRRSVDEIRSRLALEHRLALEK